MSFTSQPDRYRGRLAPTPTGLLHLGHARTFWIAQQRALAAGGELILRDEDLDRDRCRPEFAAAMLEDLAWFGLRWQEGPDIGGPRAPYRQSERRDWYLWVWQRLAQCGAIYPSPHSRKVIQEVITAPQEGEFEPLFPVQFRPPAGTGMGETAPGAVNWRFRVPDGRAISFQDGKYGIVTFTAGQDFGDFLIWRKDGVPAYEMSVVADDYAMQITEVVRGADLLMSTARQLLIYEALGWRSPEFYHCTLVRDENGLRLAKRTHAQALRTLKEQGRTPEEIRNSPLFTDELD